jgi:hypothetical protein
MPWPRGHFRLSTGRWCEPRISIIWQEMTTSLLPHEPHLVRTRNSPSTYKRDHMVPFMLFVLLSAKNSALRSFLYGHSGTFSLARATAPSLRAKGEPHTRKKPMFEYLSIPENEKSRRIALRCLVRDVCSGMPGIRFMPTSVAFLK